MVSFTDAIEDTRVVISGISGRFPSSDNVKELQDNLLNCEDCTSVHHDRWDDFESEDLPHKIGVFKNSRKFDRVFFGINLKMANFMDPTTRLMMEHCFEAVMDAGVNPRTLRGSNTAVFTATNLAEAEKSLFHSNVQLDGLGIMGCSKAMLPNRVSFCMNLRGPSINIDCGDTGAGSALQKAIDAIKSGQCDAALVGGASQCLHPHVSYQLRKLGLLSGDGFTRCFDDKAEGFTRSEAIAVLFLQRAQDAKRIYMEVVNTRTLHVDSFERKSSLYPEMEPQVELMKSLLEESRLTPDDISFFEASGMSIPDLDATELNAIDAVYGRRKNPLPIGSVKSNIGNTIAANVNAAIIKMIVAAETEKIPPNLYYETPNSRVPSLREGRLKVSTELTSLAGPYCAVNATSPSGTISHTILKAPNIVKKNNGVPDDELPRLVIVSGRTESAVEKMLKYMEVTPLDVEFLQLLYDIFQTEIDGHLHRGYMLLPPKGLLQMNSSCKKEITFTSGEKPQVWWVFSGMGSQWVGMGEALLKLPVFAASIKRCDAVLKPLGYDIFKVITEKDPQMFDQIINSFIGIAAIQIGLVDVLRAVGLEPDFIIGHSVGELGCAYADGCFTAEQMILAALSRGLASVESKLDRGSMAAVGLGYNDVKNLCPPDIDVACHNGPDSSTISGPAESMKAFVADLQAKGIFAREVPCSNIAFHSRYIAAAGNKLLEKLQKVIPAPKSRSAKWLSTSVPKSEWNTMKARLSSAEYHTNNLLSSVLFEETSRQIPANALCIEIAPHGLLQAILKRSLPNGCINIPLMRRGDPDNLVFLLTALGKLFNAGLQPQVANLYPKVQYPVGRGTASISSLVEWDHSDDWPVQFYCPLPEVHNGIVEFEIDLNEEKGKYLQGYVINGKFVIPLSLCLMKTWEIFESYEKDQEHNVAFKEVKIRKPLIEISDDNIIRFSVTVFKGSRDFEVSVSDEIVITGKIEATEIEKNQSDSNQTKDIERNLDMNHEDFYTELEMRGYQYPQAFRKIIKSSSDGTRALIKWDSDWVTFVDSTLQLYNIGNDLRVVEVPLLIRTMTINLKLHETAIKSTNGVKTVINRKLNYLTSGGLEIRGIKFAAMPKNIEQNKITNDIVSVIPNVDNSNLPISSGLRVILQLILENTFSNKIQKIELIDNNNLEDIMKFKNAMIDIPEATFFRTQMISYEEAKFNKALAVVTDFKNYNLQEISDRLDRNKFLLTFINSDQKDFYKKQAESVGLVVILMRKHVNKTLLLLRKKETLTNIQILHLSENINQSINKIKNTAISENERLIVIIKSDDVNHVIKCVDQIQESVNLEKIRIFNVQSSKILDNVILEQCKSDLVINVLTANNIWATLRRTSISLKQKPNKHWIANKRYSNDPFSITWTEGPTIDKTNNLAEVQSSAINIQDTLIAQNLFHTDVSEIAGKNRLTQKAIGLEFSGVDLNGNRIMGITNGNAMSNLVSADPDWTWQVPKSWSFEDAATVPFSYVIAFAALYDKARVKAGQKVLLTNVSNEIGLATLHLAIYQKCDVFVIYESDAEKKLIKSLAPTLPDNRLFKSSGNSFREEIFLVTGGEGVDVLIYNYYDVNRLKIFDPILKAHSRVIYVNDLSGDHVLENIGMQMFLKEIDLQSISPQKILSYCSNAKQRLASMLKDGITNGSVKPLPRVVYPRDSLGEAFQACIARKHAEKVLVKVQPDGPNKHEALCLPRFYCSKNKSYVLIEGLSRFGIELVDWLVTRGAKHFVLTSSGKASSSAYQNFRMKLWRSYGVKLTVLQEFNPSSASLQSLLKEASKLGAVDALFDLQRMSASSEKAEARSSTFDSVTKAVDEVSRSTCPSLRLFVVCSTTRNPKSLTPFNKLEHFNGVSCENAVVEKVLEQRKKDNLPGLFVKWGLEDYPAECTDNIQARVLPPITKYLQKLDEILGTEENVIDVSYIVPSTNEIDDDLEVELTPEEKDKKEFTANFFEQSGVGIINFSYLQIKDKNSK